jgi:hypothetical protein
MKTQISNAAFAAHKDEVTAGVQGEVITRQGRSTKVNTLPNGGHLGISKSAIGL